MAGLKSWGGAGWLRLLNCSKHLFDELVRSGEAGNPALMTQAVCQCGGVLFWENSWRSIYSKLKINPKKQA